MIVYYDLIFLINFIYQFGILYFTNRILHCARAVVKIIFASLLQCFLFVIITVLTLERQTAMGQILNLALSFIISAVLFQTDTIKKLFRMILTELLLCILMGGILTLMYTYLSNASIMVTAIGALVFLGFFLGSIKDLFSHGIGKKNCLYQVRIIHKEREIFASGLLDSGNGLTDPISGEPVCILACDLCRKLLGSGEVEKQSGYRIIPYHTIGKNCGIMEAFFVDDLEIQQTTNEDIPFLYHRILCAVCPDNFSERSAYEVILHPKLLTG